MNQTVITSEKDKSAKNMAFAVYGLLAVGLLSFGILTVIALVINLAKKDDAIGTVAESHFRWQFRTILFGFIGFVIGGLTAILVVGWFILLATVVWYVYRIAKGALYLSDNKPVYQQ